MHMNRHGIADTDPFTDPYTGTNMATMHIDIGEMRFYGSFI